MIKDLFSNLKAMHGNFREWFASSNVFKQLFVVSGIGFVTVMLVGTLFGSIEDMYQVFVDPPALILAKGSTFKLVFSLFYMMAGLVLTGFVISILSAALENTLREVRQGSLKYSGRNHTLIINYNHKLETILDELNILHEESSSKHHVVVFFNNETTEKKENEIANLKTKVKNNYSNLRVYFRNGNTMNSQRYIELSIIHVKSVIVLSEELIASEFEKNNNNIRIVSLLLSEKVKSEGITFKEYLVKKKTDMDPVKAIVEFTKKNNLHEIIQDMSSNLFLAISPRSILSSILNLSMINIHFYHIWSKALSFDCHDMYFKSYEQLGLNASIEPVTFKDLLLRQKKGTILGVSRRGEGGNIDLLLNQNDLELQETDWFICFAKNKDAIELYEEAKKENFDTKINAPKEVFERNIIFLGDKNSIEENEHLSNKDELIHIESVADELFYKKDFYDELLNKKFQNGKITDAIIVNFDDEKNYRLALTLKSFYKGMVPNQFVFLVDSSLICEQLKLVSINNIILAYELTSKYITQIANQIALHKVFAKIFEKKGAEFNFISKNEIQHSDTERLRIELIHSNMIYVGVITQSEEVIFEAQDISNAKYIIVFSNGGE